MKRNKIIDIMQIVFLGISSFIVVILIVNVFKYFSLRRVEFLFKYWKIYVALFVSVALSGILGRFRL
jgi:hypothetical protein